MSNCAAVCDPDFHVGTHIEIRLHFREFLFNWDSVQDFKVIFNLRDTDPAVRVDFSLQNHEVLISSTEVLLRIEEHKVNVPGIYNVAGELTDQLGRVWGVSMCPTIIKFI